MDILQAQKNELRHSIREKAKSLDAAYLHSSDKAIHQALFSLGAWKAARTVFAYASIGSEPSTTAIIQAAWQAGKRVAIPRCLSGGLMEAREIVSFEGLIPGPFGIMEPGKTSALLAPAAMDIVIVPCVAADRQGNRLGNGGGYYDRYLPQTHCPTICLCRDVFLLDCLPVDALDMPVSAVLTERGTWVRAKG